MNEFTIDSGIIHWDPCISHLCSRVRYTSLCIPRALNKLFISVYLYQYLYPRYCPTSYWISHVVHLFGYGTWVPFIVFRVFVCRSTRGDLIFFGFGYKFRPKNIFFLTLKKSPVIFFRISIIWFMNRVVGWFLELILEIGLLFL